MVPLDDLLKDASHRLQTNADLDPLLARIGEARYVLLGEASHGTSDYYTWRARISQRLIEEKGFSFVSVEGDWPDCYAVNRFVRGVHDMAQSGFDVLHAFDRWPTWMWANWETVAFVDWLRKWNEGRDPTAKAGFYGLDVYSLFDSMDQVIEHLTISHPDLVEPARQAFACFDPYERESQSYAYSTAVLGADCEREVIGVLKSLLESRTTPGAEDPEAHFNAEMNARAAVDAERYYKTMMRGNATSWNIRDTHMMDTLDLLMDRAGPQAKAIVWEHNTHIGDARATDMADAGMVNVGQLCRERHPDETVLVGFAGYEGGVVAAKAWGDPMERMPMPPAREGSWEHWLHNAFGDNRLIFVDRLRGHWQAEQPRGHRAIGVVYHRERERYGNYVPTNIPERYDVLLYIDRCSPVHPLHFPAVAGKEPPETYPFTM